MWIKPKYMGKSFTSLLSIRYRHLDRDYLNLRERSIYFDHFFYITSNNFNITSNEEGNVRNYVSHAMKGALIVYKYFYSKILLVFKKNHTIQFIRFEKVRALLYLLYQNIITNIAYNKLLKICG